MPWLFKTDPKEFSFDDFMDRWQVAWTRAKSKADLEAIYHLGPDDDIVVYHLGEERAVGLGRVITFGTPPFVEANRKLIKPVTLAQMKAHPRFNDPKFKGGELLREPARRVVWLTSWEFNAILDMADTHLLKL